MTMTTDEHNDIMQKNIMTRLCVTFEGRAFEKMIHSL